MRVTEGMRYAQVLSNLADLTSRHAEATQVAASGLRVGKPSDDPIAAAELARLSASSSQTKTHLATIDKVRGDAELTESTLSDASDIMVRLKEIAVQASSEDISAQDRANLNVEVQGLRDSLLKLGNTKGTRGYLFSGSAVTTAAFDTAGVFQGNDDDHVVQIGNTSPTAVSTSAADSFVVAGGRDVFADVTALATALGANDLVNVRAALDNIGASHAQLVNARARAGLVISKLDASQSILDSVDTEEQRRAQTVGAADPYESYTRVTALGQSLDRAISVSKQLLELGGQNRF
jgi:flagellar hook-associated protein 3 FlgL